MKPLLPLVLLFAASAIAGIKGDPPAIPDLPTLLKEADTAVVYEGLPHSTFERDSFDEEKRTKKTFSVSGEFFYPEPLAMPEADRNALDQIFRTTAVCVPFGGEKLCGGFHADYMIEWKRKDERVAVALLCFGCHELLVITGKDSSLRTDMSKAGFEALHPILKKYRQQRPPFAGGAKKPLKPEAIPLPPPKIDVQLWGESSRVGVAPRPQL